MKITCTYVYKRNDVLINLTGNFTECTCTHMYWKYSLWLFKINDFKTKGKKDSTTYMYIKWSYHNGYREGGIINGITADYP